MFWKNLIFVPNLSRKVNTKKTNLINLIKRRRFNYAACDEYVAKAYSKRDSTIDINTPLSFRQRQSWASRKVNINVVNDFNNFYKLYQKSPAFARLNEIYFN